MARISPIERLPAFTVVSYHETKASALTAMELYDAHSYIHSHNDGKRGKAVTYKCAEHDKCGRFFRVRETRATESAIMSFVLEVKGSHSGNITGHKRKGIHPAFAVEVDAASMGKDGPQAILNSLMMKYEGQPHLLSNLPTRSMIKSRRQYLMGKAADAMKIETFADLYQWASLRMCKTEARFFNEKTFDRTSDEAVFSMESSGVQNELLVLKCFEHRYEEDGISKKSFGLIMTTRRVFRNVLYAVEGQQSDGVFAAADGTYKLHHGKWVLVAFGTYRNRYTDKHVYSKNFVPWAYLFVRTEHQYAYEQLYRTVAECTDLFFKVKLAVKYGSLDHASYIANAYMAVWPGIILLDCYPHVARKCREKIALLTTPDYYKTNIEINIRQMHHARSSEEFKMLAKLCTDKWREDKQIEYADWFTKVYLSELWSRWHTMSAIPGILPSQNALESHNRAIKTCGVRFKRAKTGVVLNDSMPRILTMVGTDCATGPFGHYCEGPLPSQMVLRALEHVAPGAYWIERERKGRKNVLRSIFFNSTAYLTNGDEVTKDRVTRYCEAKNGIIQQDDTVQGINLFFLSLHQVEVIGDHDEMSRFQFNLAPVITSDKIKEVRELYRCDCKAFMSTGWACSHVVAAMDLNKQFDLDLATTRLPTKKLSGGQRKVPGALTRDSTGARSFSATNLIKRLQREPMYVHNWQVCKDFIFEEDGVETTEFITGRIKGAIQKNGIYQWRVKFDDGDELFYECQDMADIIVASRKIGLDVTSNENAEETG
ncbi:hypothetical protein DVH05_026361 [Phytophthora capsici]|nr:hypothetical protein DVH05_026361 [Phytophthora capsici]